MAESWGVSAEPIAPPSGPEVATCKRQRLARHLPTEIADSSVLDDRRCLFCEFFAGRGSLTFAVEAAGVPARSPDDLASGGVDFSDKKAVDELRTELGELSASGVKLMVHFAPPCSTFSRARCRSGKTRLRSSAFPQGLPRFARYTRTANLIARNTLDFAEWLVRDLGAAVSLENPKSSFLWSFLDFDQSQWWLRLFSALAKLLYVSPTTLSIGPKFGTK